MDRRLLHFLGKQSNDDFWTIYTEDKETHEEKKILLINLRNDVVTFETYWLKFGFVSY